MVSHDPSRGRVGKRTPKSKAKFPIVGIGASAGGLEALLQIFEGLPSTPGVGIVVVQHLDPAHDSLSVEILSHKSRLPVQEARNRCRVCINQVYLIPPNHYLEIKRGILYLSPRPKLGVLPLAVDFFLESLALDQKTHALGVILSGTGTDGTQGLAKIQNEGGVSIAQAPATAQYDAMPRHAISAGVVDLVLSPQKIAELLTGFVGQPKMSLLNHPDRSRTSQNEILGEIFNLLKDRAHVDFSHYKMSTLLRRIERRMTLHKKERLEDYYHFLLSHAEEVPFLFSDLLIHVTEFFRDPEVFEALEKQVLAKILKGREAGQPIRIWVLGCATGEEAYSVTIALFETLRKAELKVSVQVFATDISEPALQKARLGIYPESIRRNLSEDLLKRYFVKIENGYRIGKQVREVCLFSRHDVTSDPPFARLDLICCRNLLIYFDSALQKQIFPTLHYALNPDGILWLGGSESVGENSNLFKVLNKSCKFYTRVATQAKQRLRFGKNSYLPEGLSLSQNPGFRSFSGPYELLKDVNHLIAVEYGPPGVVVNGQMDIVLTRGDTTPYLRLPAGQMSANLFKMARLDLVSDLRMAVQAAKKKKARVQKASLLIGDVQNRVAVNLTVIPLMVPPKIQDRSFLILFERENRAELLPGSSSSRKRGGHFKETELRIKKLEQQLAEAKSYEQTLIEDHEAIQEEVTTANEELQSANEELQTSNEELETAREELQSTNEELMTVNDELQASNSDLVHLNNDLLNFLGSVDIPIMMADGEAKVRRFTPSATRFLSLIPSDVGRLIRDVKPRFEGPNLEEWVREVVRLNTALEQEVCDSEGRWYRLQARPYRTTDNRIDGAVFSWLDITLLKQNLSQSQAALEYATSVADTLALPLIVLDEKLRILSVNQGFSSFFGIPLQAAIGQDLVHILDGQTAGVSRLRQVLGAVIVRDHPLRDYEIELQSPRLGHRIMLLTANRIHWSSLSHEKMPKALLLSLDDVTDRRVLERSLQYSEERFRVLVGSAHEAILILTKDERIEFANRQALDEFDYPMEALLGKKLDLLIPTEISLDAFNKDLEASARRKDGSEFPIEVSLSPIRLPHEMQIAVVIRNVSKAKALTAEKALLLSKEQSARSEAEVAKGKMERANAAKDLFLGTLSHELRTPLTAILSWSQLLKRVEMNPEQIKHGLNTIEQNAITQGQLINDLLDISRIQSGKLALNLADVNPLVSVRAAVESVRPIATSKKVVIELHEEMSECRVQADASRLQQVLWNLLTNSIKFSPEGAQIEVWVNAVELHSKSFVSIRVVDHGKGILPSFLPHLFTRFSQQDSSSTRVHGGLGIGLALVRDLVLAHHGAVHAQSEGAGKGAIFTVNLPLLKGSHWVTQPVQTSTVESGQELSLQGLKVLLVDDEAASLDAFAEIVKAYGGVALTSGSVSEALQVLENCEPHLLVSDVAMPGEDGYSLIRKIRKSRGGRQRAIAAIALTAYASERDREQAIDAGFDEHLSKPVDSEALVRTLVRLAKRSKKT